MISGTTNSTLTLKSSSDSIELRHMREQIMDSQKNELSAGYASHQLVNAKIKLATEPIFRQVERL